MKRAYFANTNPSENSLMRRSIRPITLNYSRMKKLILSALVFCFFYTLKAQDENYPIKEQNPSLAVSIVPKSFANNGAELNLDIRVADRQWLTIAPRFQFAGNNSNNLYDASDAITGGFGLGLNYRYFPLTLHSKKFSDGIGPFISAGLRGQNTTYEYRGDSYVAYTDDVYGVSGYTIDNNTPYTDKISQLSLEINIGYVLRFFDILFVESYMGIGTRLSNYEYDSLRGMNLGEYSWDTGFNGYCFTGGFRFGIFLNRYTRKEK